MTPLINRAKPIPFYDLGPDTFQRLCRALCAELREVKDAIIYGKNGQLQRGIDLEITLLTTRRWVIQCKACGQDELKHLEAAVDNFLPYFDHWKAAGAEKFIVVLGCGIEDTKVHDAKRAYEKQFRERGMEFELWDSPNLRRLLRQMRSVVEQFLDPWFVNEICGPPTPSGLSINSVEWEYMARPSALIAELGSTHNEKIDCLRDLIRRGKEPAAEAELRSLQTTVAWEMLTPEIKARVFRLLAAIALDRRGDVDHARQLLGEAKELYPSGRYVVLEMSILHRTSGAVAALAAMPEPLTPDEWHLRAALQINAGKNDDAVQTLLAPAFEADAETFRLRALAYLQRREIVPARQAAAEAASHAPNWALVRQAVALTEYFSAISDIFQGWMHWRWPLPVDWYLVRSDAESRTALRRAAESFADLAADEDHGSEAWQHAKGWQLAAIANDSARQAEAAELARQILAVQPAATVAIAWSLARGYEFPQEPTERALENLCGHDPKSAEPVQALVNLFVSRGNFDGARSLLDAQRPMYEQNGLAEAWCFQRGQLWVLEGQPEKAEALLSNQPDDTLRARSKVTFARLATKREEWSPELLASLREAATQDASSELLFEVCEAHYSAGEYNYVVERADELVRRVGTESCLRLALDAAVSSKHFNECLGLMERYRPLFREGDFPPVIRRMRGVCLRAVGRYIEAEQEFRSLTSDGGAPGDRYALFQLQLDTGRASDASTTARTLLDDPAITAEGLLLIADRLRSDDPDLARTFVSQAVKRGVQTTQGAALGTQVAISLGLDEMASGWIVKTISSAGQPDAPVKPFTIAQFLEIEQEQKRARAGLNQGYRCGQLTMHALSHQLGEPLVSFLHSHLLYNEASQVPPDQRWSLRVRHGSRRTPAKLGKAEGVQLFMDVTSVMLTAHLDLLETIEEEFAPIGISSRLLECIQAQLNALTTGQPVRVPPKQEVLSLVAANQISVVKSEDMPIVEDSPLATQMGVDWCARLKHVRNNDGWLVGFKPIIARGPEDVSVVLPDEEIPFVRGVGDVLSALSSAGEVTRPQIESARLRLGSLLLPAEANASIEQEKFILLEHDLGAQLAHAGLLQILTRWAKVHIQADEVEELQKEIKAVADREKFGKWLRELRERLRSGLDRGIYKEQPNAQSPTEGEALPASPEVSCLWDFLDPTRGKSTLSCCDDRLLGRFSKVGESRIVDTFDLLWCLHRRGRLSIDELFARLHRLRTANLRYLPISSAEILYHLHKAQINEGKVVETPELATLRRYSAACLLDFSVLQHLPKDHPEAMKHSEMLFVPGLQQEVCGAIRELWKNQRFSTADCTAWSDWLIEAMWFDLAGLPTVAEKPLPVNQSVLGMSESHLVLEALAIGPDDPAQQRYERRTAYLAWVFSRLGGEPRRMKYFGKEIVRTLVSLVRDHPKPDERQAASNLASQVFECLPPNAKDELDFTPRELRLIGWERYQPVVFHDVTFDSRTFWPAAERALNGESTSVEAKDTTNSDFSLAADESHAEAALLVKAEGCTRFRIVDPVLGLLCADKTKRLEAVEGLRSVLDRNPSEAKVIFPRIARQKNVTKRMRSLLELKRESFANQLKEIAIELHQKNQLDQRLARPIGVAPLLRHLRLPESFAQGELPTLLEGAAHALVTEVGFQEAFERTATLPVLLPNVLRAGFRHLSASQKAEILEWFTARTTSPLLRFQGAGLLFAGGEAEQTLAVEIIEALFGPETTPIWHLFEELLAWTESWLAASDKNRSYRTPTTLGATWVHASRLLHLLTVARDPDRLAAIFHADSPSPTNCVFDPAFNFYHEVADPRRFNRTRFLVLGLSHVLGDIALSKELCQRLNKVLQEAVFPTETPGSPALVLLEQRTSATNRLGSFLGTCNTDSMAAILGHDLADRFSDATIERDVSGYIEALSTGPNKPESWVCLAVYLTIGKPAAHLQTVFHQAVFGFSFKALSEPTLNQLQLIAMFLFGQASNFGNSLETNFWEAKLLELAEVVFDPKRSFPKREGALLVGNSAFLLSTSLSDETQAVTWFNELLGKIAQRWTLAADVLLQPAIRIILRQPSRSLAQSLRGMTQLRCAAKRLQHI